MAAPSRGWMSLPLFRSLAGYRAPDLGPDLIAGLTLAAIVIPEQMATARLAGLPPQAGFFAFIAAAAAFLVFGASRYMSVGADSTIAPIFAAGLALLAAGGSSDYLALAAILALMVGVLVLGAGLARMGWIANLLSEPVTVGFLAGIAVHIAVSQASSAMGVAAPGGSLPQQIAGLVMAAPHASLAALAIAGGVAALTTIAHLISPRIPGPLVGLIGATWAVQALHLPVAVLGHVPAGLPGLGLPAMTPEQVLGARAAGDPDRAGGDGADRARPRAPSRRICDEPPDINGDYVGLGAANIAAAVFGGFPVDASPPRTGVAAESGGRSQITSLVAVAVVVLLLLFGAGLLTEAPRAALSGVLLFVAARIVRVTGDAANSAREPGGVRPDPRDRGGDRHPPDPERRGRRHRPFAALRHVVERAAAHLRAAPRARLDGLVADDADQQGRDAGGRQRDRVPGPAHLHQRRHLPRDDVRPHRPRRKRRSSCWCSRRPA